MAREEMDEANEIKEVKETEKRNEKVAAFFDLDGTLLPMPSLEKRFFLMLRYRRAIGVGNYFTWLAEAVRLLPHGLNRVLQANKMYLRGVRVVEKDALNVPSFFPEALERLAWHAERGHLIVIVSGTLEALAESAIGELHSEFAARGCACAIRICATRLENDDDRWTGRIIGDAMFGEAKARAIKELAVREQLNLQRCFAYGDSTNDKWMLECVGKPTAINPSNDLARIARRKDWPVFRWHVEKRSALRIQKMQTAGISEKKKHTLPDVQAKAGFSA